MNSLPKTPAISAWLLNATQTLQEAGIISAKLDAEIILAHTIRKNRTFLHAHPDELLTLRQTEIADARLALRKDRTPIAYITGHKEFYGRQFKVTPATLIPRPESEALIALLKKHTSSLPANTSPQLVDVGTGSGCLGITAKLEFPRFDVTLTDISRHALHVAGENAMHHHVDVTLLRSDLLLHYPLRAHVIIANLPYVDPEWEHSPEIHHEPKEALFTSDNGLHLIYKLLGQVANHLLPAGIILLEADPRQHHPIIHAAAKQGLELVETEGFAIALKQR